MPNRTKFVENPAWATDAVARSWDLMTEAVPAAYRPVLDSVKATSADSLTGQVHEYGCGRYGCVFQTHDPGVVLKVTTDTTEAEFAAHIAQSLVRPICVHYFAVVSLNLRHQNRPVFLLWRESASRVGELAKVLGARAAELVTAQHQAAVIAYQALNGLEVPIKGRPHEVMQKAIGMWLNACEAMARQSTVPELRALGDGLVEVYDQQRIVFGDIHDGNLGIVHRPDGGHWVVTDPGHVAVVDL